MTSHEHALGAECNWSQSEKDAPASALSAFISGDYRRLRVGAYRVMYVVEDDLIAIERIDLVV